MNQQLYAIIGVPGARGVQIDDLRMAAKIIKDDTESLNQATLTIFNANAQTLANAYPLDERQAVAQIFYGRGDDISDASLGYVGDITSLKPKPGRVDRQYVLNCGEKKNTLARAKTVASFGSGVSVGEYLDRCARDLEMGDDEREQFLANVPPRILKTKSALRRSNGQTRTALSRLAKAHSFDWLYVDGRLVILERDAPLSMPAVLATPETGLIGTPVYTRVGKRVGWRIKMSAQTGIVPRRLLDVRSSSLNGVVMVRRAEANVSNWTTPFEVDVFAQEI